MSNPRSRAPRRNANLGQVRMRARSARSDPMREFDALPAPVRGWLAQAVLPWSPRSCRQLWERYKAQGLGTQECLDRMTRAEARLLDRQSLAC